MSEPSDIDEFELCELPITGGFAVKQNCRILLTRSGPMRQFKRTTWKTRKGAQRAVNKLEAWRAMRHAARLAAQAAEARKYGL